MKRISYVLMFFVLLFAVSTTAFAEDFTDYYLEELGMEISIPSDFFTLTRNVENGDPALAHIGGTVDDVLAFFEENLIYLDAVDEKFTVEIIIVMKDLPLGDMNELSELTIQTAIDTRKDMYTSAGLTWIGAEMFQHRQAKFMVVDCTRDDGGYTTYMREYYTLYKNKAISITYFSYLGEFQQADSDLLGAIIDSISFKNDSADPEPEPEADPAPSHPVTYRDESTGTTFMVPAGWKITTTNKENIEASFSPAADPGVIFLYSSVDTYADTLEGSKQDGITLPFDTRAEYDRLVSDKEDAAAALSCEVSEVRTAVYGKATYYYTEKVLDMSYGKQPVVVLMRVENGIMYYFQFYGKKDSQYFRDIEEMLGSAEYTHAEVQDIIDARQDELWSRLSPVNLILSLIITVAVYSLPIFIYRFVLRRRPVEKKKAKIITIVYGICAFVVMSVILFLLGSGVAGTAIILWSWVNYKVLISGAEKPQKSAAVESSTVWDALEQNAVSQESAPQEPVLQEPAAQEQSGGEAEPQPEHKYCTKCGTELTEDARFCTKCGAAVE